MEITFYGSFFFVKGKKEKFICTSDKARFSCSYNVLDTFSVCLLVFLSVEQDLLCDIKDKSLIL